MERVRLVVIAGVLLVVTLVIILVIALADQHDVISRFEEDNECLDLAVIGAGISGAYAAWKLKDSDLKIGVFELSDRVGGRLHTKHLPTVPDINIELGGRRFHPIQHRLMNKTIQILGLPVTEVISRRDDATEMMYYLRGIRLYESDMDKKETPYRLRVEDRMKPKQLRWHLLSTKTNYSGNNDNFANLLKIKTDDGIPLYKQSPELLFPKISNLEAHKYMSDSHTAPWLPGISALGVLDDDPRLLAASNFWTISSGMDQIPKTLLQQFLDQSHGHSLHLDKQLVKIDRTSTKDYRLIFRDTATTVGRTLKVEGKQTVVCTKKAILAVSRKALQDIELPVPITAVVKKHSEAVKDNHCGRIYLVYETPWWRHQFIKFTHVYTDLPTRKTYDVGVSEKTKRAVLQAAYFCNDAVSFWKQLGSLDLLSGDVPESIYEVNDHIVHQLHSNLADIYNISIDQIPQPVDRVMRIWDDHIDGGAFTLWNARYDWKEVSDSINKPSPTDDIYIASSSYIAGPYLTAWCEGALKKVEEILDLLRM